MNKTIKRPDSGFTIIEVVLVLAIAALIMLMVFLALPALQRGQRDTQRKDDISRFQSAINNYMSANRGNVPSDWDQFVEDHMRIAGDSFADPSATNYYVKDATSSSSGQWAFSNALGGASSVEEMYKDTSAGGLASALYVIKGGTCNFEDQRVDGAESTSRKVAIVKALEDGNYACREAS